MSTILRNPRTFQNRNRTITRAQELMRSTHRSQQKELDAQQRLILSQQLKQLQQKQKHHRRLKTGTDGDERKEDDTDEPDFDSKTNNDDELDSKAHPTTNPSENPNPQPTIFVSIASYRDPECLKTVLDLFAKADHPNRVFVGVYEQNDPETDKDMTISYLLEAAPDKIAPLDQYYKSGNLRPMITSCVEAKGPMYARALIEQKLFQNEDFYMIIDSHALFEPNWDSMCVQEWERASKLCESTKTKAVLSYFPPNFQRAKRQRTPLEFDPTLKLDYLRFMQFEKNFGVPMPTKQAFKNMPREPVRALFWTACFSFASASMLKEVPFDDGYPYLFLGEEIYMNMRLFTHGYDVFNPSKHILYHLENRDYRPIFWELTHVDKPPKDASFVVTDEERDARKTLHLASMKRMSQILYNHPEHGIDDKYALGQERSYKEFCDFIGINFEKQVVKEHTRFGRTPHPSKEEQYAKMVENKTEKIAKLNMAPINMKMNQGQGRMNGHKQATHLTPRMNPMKMNQNKMNGTNVRNGSMTKMTGLTGGGIQTTPTQPKEIPRTRVPRVNGMPKQNAVQTGRTGPPRAREYAIGMWGKQ